MSNFPQFFNRDSSTNNPFRDLRRMQRQLDRAFPRTWPTLWEEQWNPESFDLQIAPINAPAFTPSCDVEETETYYLMSFDLPGVKKDDIKIDLRDGILTVSGERNEEYTEKKGKKYQSERFLGAFQRSFQVPSDTKAEQIEAHYDNCVLRVAVPKLNAAKASPIKISEGKTGFLDKFLGHKKEENNGNNVSKTSTSEQQRTSVKIV